MKDGVYIVRGGKTYRVTNDSKCTKRSCSLYDANVCQSCDGEPPCLELLRFADRVCGSATFDFSNFKEVKNA